MPYAPQTYSYAPQSLYAGASGFGKNLGNFIGDYIDRGRKSKALDGLLSAYAPQDSEEGKQLKSALPGMSLEEKQGLVQAHAVKDYQAQQARADRLSEAQIGAYRGQEEERKARAEQDRAQGALPGEWMKAAAEPSNYVEENAAPRGMNMASYVEAAGRSGARLDPRMISEYMDQGKGGGTLAFDEDPVSGNRYARYRNTVLPSGVNPAKMSADAEAVLDPEGNTLGYGTRDPKGRLTMLRGERGGITDKDMLGALQKQYANTYDPAKKAALGTQIEELLNKRKGSENPAAKGGGEKGGFGDLLLEKFNSTKAGKNYNAITNAVDGKGDPAGDLLAGTKAGKKVKMVGDLIDGKEGAMDDALGSTKAGQKIGKYKKLMKLLGKE